MCIEGADGYCTELVVQLDRSFLHIITLLSELGALETPDPSKVRLLLEGARVPLWKVPRALHLGDGDVLQLLYEQHGGADDATTPEPAAAATEEPRVHAAVRAQRLALPCPGYMRLQPWLHAVAASVKGVAQVIKHENQGPAFSLSLTPMYSLRHRLVRSRQYASGSVAGFLRF